MNLVTAKFRGWALAKQGERFGTTEDLAGAVGISPSDDDNATELMFAAARGYHAAGALFDDDEERNTFQ